MRMELQVSAGNLKYALLIWRIFKSRSLWRSFTSSIHEIIPWGDRLFITNRLLPWAVRQNGAQLISADASMALQGH